MTLYPTGHVTVACGPLVISLFEAVPRLDRIIALKKQSWNRHWLKLWSEVAGTQWDVVVDLRNSAVSRLIRADKRYIYGPHIGQNQHKVLQNAAVMGCLTPPTPCLFITEGQHKKAKGIITEGSPVLAIGPTANWIGKIWPVENFIELLPMLMGVGGCFHGWRVAVFAAPNEEHIAQQVYNTIPENIRIDVIAKGNPAEAAACLSRCQFYIGNDSGLMHCAAAAGIPTIGLFGPTNDVVYGPYGMNSALVRTPQSLHDLIGVPDFNAKTLGHSLMSGLCVDSVYRAVQALVSKTNAVG